MYRVISEAMKGIDSILRICLNRIKVRVWLENFRRVGVWFVLYGNGMEELNR